VTVYKKMQAGTKARVYGLVKAPKYNGKTGEMVGLDPDTGRYWIQFDDGGERMKLKRDNVMAIEHNEEVGGPPSVGKGTLQGVLSKLVAINKSSACAVLKSHSGRKFQAFDFYDEGEQDPLGHGRHKIQYAVSENRDQAEAFLRGETIEYLECSNKVADTIADDVRKNDDGEVLTDLASGLQLIQSYLSVEAGALPDNGGLLICNGLCYCAEHRREVCAACCTDHRITNRLAELDQGIPHPKAFNIASRLVDDERRKNALARMAPEAGEVQGEVKLPTQYDKKKLLASGLDPTSLPLWAKNAQGQVAQSFQQSFSFREIWNDKPSDDPMYDMRQTLLAIAGSCDEAGPIPRFIIQDEAKTAAMMIDVLEIRAAESRDWDGVDEKFREGLEDAPDKESDPVLVVRYIYNTAASMSREVVESIDASLKAMPPGHPMASIPTILPAVNLLHELLKKSTARLDASFVKQAQRTTCKWKGWQISVLQPVHKAKVKDTTKSHECCLKCGKTNAKMNVCSKCKVAKYCSKDCQKSHWKQHKSTCTPPEAKDGAEVATVNLSVSGLPDEMLKMAGNTDELYSMNVNNDAGMGSRKVGKLNTTGKHDAKKDRMFVVKVQVPMSLQGPSGQRDMGTGSMMCYDAKQKLNVHISERNCPDARRLASAIRSRGGHPQGLKAYLNAYVTAENELKILYHEMLPMQPW